MAVPTAPLTPELAEAEIRARMTPLAIESLPLRQCVGATLREDIHAERDNPPFDRVAMDGIAVSSEALRRGSTRFRIQATQTAGSAALTLDAGDSAIEVMTGAIMPLAADCVIPVEQYQVDQGLASLSAAVNMTPLRNVHCRGSDGGAGSLVLEAGTLLRPPEIAVAASAGMARLHVSRQPSFMIISTGDELIEPGEPIAEHQVRRSNAYGVMAALRSRGFSRIGDDHLADDESLLRQRLMVHLTTHDVLILSGGVSMGKFDLIPKVLAQLGVQQVFHKVAQRPGRPMWFGIGPGGQAVFGLPGNPVSTLVCLLRYVVTALASAMGTKSTTPERVALAAPLELDLAMTYFLPVALEYDHRGTPRAQPRPTNGSGDFVTLTGTDGFIELPPTAAPYPRGHVARIFRW